MIEQFENKIINADCLDILKQLPDKCIDLVLTDPPYGIKMAKNTNICTKLDIYGKDKKGFYKRELHKQKDWDNQRPSEEVFNEIMRVSKNQIIFGGNYFADLLPPTRGWIVWDKKETENQGSNFADCELAYTSFDRNIKKYKFGWVGIDYINNRKDEIKIHPTQKPSELFKMILQDYSKEGDLIADFFSGSGTTAVASWNLKRRFVCVEKDFDYWKASCKRLEDHQRQGVLF